GRGGLKLRTGRVDVHAILSEAADVCQPQARARNVSIAVSLRAEHRHVWGDGPRLRQVFWNLVINAIKFSRGGRVEVDSQNGREAHLIVRVTDGGIGMDSETLDALFLPFEQRPPSASGLGLGLAICKGIVDAHNGRIWANSPGRGWGSTFEVDLPVAPVGEAARPAAPPPADRAAGFPRRRRILLLEG